MTVLENKKEKSMSNEEKLKLEEFVAGLTQEERKRLLEFIENEERNRV